MYAFVYGCNERVCVCVCVPAVWTQTVLGQTTATHNAAVAAVATAAALEPSRWQYTTANVKLGRPHKIPMVPTRRPAFTFIAAVDNRTSARTHTNTRTHTHTHTALSG